MGVEGGLVKKEGVLTMTDGNSDKPIVTQRMDTDFPLGSVKFYLENGVLMLPSER